MLKNKKEMKKHEDTLKEFAKCVTCMLDAGISKDEIGFAVKVGFEAYEEFKKPKVTKIKISGNSKEDLFRQVRKLELDKDIEKDILNIIEKECL